MALCYAVIESITDSNSEDACKAEGILRGETNDVV
jgi:hypothetical protein